jgi:hypothetical protein
MIPKKYRLKDGSIYWHKLYFDNVPKFLTHSSPPFGSYNWAFYLYQPHKYIIELVDEVRYFIQRGRRGWSERDVWGWFAHHSEMMVGVLQYLRKHKHGYPIGLTPGKWAKKLEVMEQGFQAAIDEENDYTSYKRLSRKDHRKLIFSRRRKLMLGLKYFRTHYYSLWD